MVESITDTIGGWGTVYNRQQSTGFALIDEWDRGFGWFAHSEEEGMRASHAFMFDDGVWIVDPLDSPGIDEHITRLGEVVGVTVCSSMHARDADIFAKRYDIPVYIPEGMGRVSDRLNAEIIRYQDFPARGVMVVHRNPFPGFDEGNLYHEPTRTLYIGDSLGTTPWHTIEQETIGAQAILRLFPPKGLLGVTPERIFFGHGMGIDTDAGSVLKDTVTAGRKRAPRAFVSNLPPAIRAAIASLKD